MRKRYPWSVWERARKVQSGSASFPELECMLREQQALALERMPDHDADHLLYAVKFFDERDLLEVQFCMHGMSEQDFFQAVERLEDVQFFALHRRISKRGAELQSV